MSDQATAPDISRISDKHARHVVDAIKLHGLAHASPHVDDLLIRHGEHAHTLLLRNGVVSGLLKRMLACAFNGKAKELNGLSAELRSLVPSKASGLIASAFARAADDTDRKEIVARSRLYKLACRQAGIEAAESAFVKLGIRVYCPLNGQHLVDQVGFSRKQLPVRT